MQNIQKHPMVTVKEAATALGIDERTIRDKLANEEWRGEKKLVGLKEKWYMHRGELERQLDRLQLARQERITVQGLDSVFDTTQEIDAEFSEPEPTADIGSPKEQDKPHAELFWDQFANKFLEKLEQKDQLIGELRAELTEKDRRLKLLPDLERRAEDERKLAELKALEGEALKKQIAAIEEEKHQLEDKVSEATVMTDELRLLKAQLEKLQRPWWKKLFSAA